MTTKKILFSVLILGATIANAQDKLFNEGYKNKLNNKNLIASILETSLTDNDHVAISYNVQSINQLAKIGTVDSVKNNENDSVKDYIISAIVNNYIVACDNNTIIILSKDINDCNRICEAYALAAALNK